MPSTRTALRVLVAATLTAGLLVPGWLTPVRTVAIPSTLARSVSGGRAGVSSLDFAPTHIAFSWRGPEGGHITYRTRSPSGAWSKWRRAPEAHDLAAGRRHYSGVLWVARPDSVQWRARGPVGDVTLDYLNTIDGPRRLVAAPAVADAAARDPRIVTRAEWGADESVTRTSGICTRVHHPVQQLFVHHTAGANRDPHPEATMRAILYYHAVRRGWCDIGYNFVISPGGRIFEGRSAGDYDPWELHDGEDRSARVVTGAHVAEFNSGSVGVGLMGNYSAVRVPKKARRALVGLLAWEADRHNLKPRARHIYRNPLTPVSKRLFVIAGHRDAGQTACPGGNLYRALPRIRRKVAAVIGSGKVTTRLRLGAPAQKIVFGQNLQFTGLLRTRAGAALPGRGISMWVRPALRRWTDSGRVTTGPEGRFVWLTRPRRNQKVTAFFDGDASAWSDDSRKLRVLVAPRISLVPQDASPDSSGVYRFPAGTESVDLSGRLLPRHPRSKVVVRVSEIGAEGRAELVAVETLRLDSTSAYRLRVALPHPQTGGAFTARARWWGDARHAPGASPLVRLEVEAP
jgi:hypothetical protein